MHKPKFRRVGDLNKGFRWEEIESEKPIKKSEPEKLSEEEVKKLLKADLVKYAESQGVDSSGTMDDIYSRLFN